MRDGLINSALANDSVVVSTGSASFGYLTPLKIRNVSSAEPIVDLKNVDFTVRMEDGTSGSNVVVDPTTILNNVVLTPELCNQVLPRALPKALWRR